MFYLLNGLSRLQNINLTLINRCSLIIPKPQVKPVPQVLQQPTRTLIQYSRLSGKRKTVKTVTRRFFRLNWGAWIRPISGRHKNLWRKSPAERKRARYHVFCNSTQSTMFDKMVTKFWRRPTYYVDDIYEPYQKRDNFWITRSRA